MQLVVVRADLNGHLKALKDYFLLAKGDFFQVRVGKYLTIASLCVSSNLNYYSDDSEDKIIHLKIRKCS